MRFWIQCTDFETGRPIHINIALVGSMSRDGERTVLTYVGDGQTIDVTEDAGADSRTASRTDGKGVRRVDRAFRHCEPTGRANARPMTGSAKQSIFPLAVVWIASSLRSSQ